MNWLKNLLSSRPKFWAYVFSSMSFIVLLSLTFVLIFTNEINTIADESQAAADKGLAIVSEAVEVLIEVDQRGLNDCSENTLVELRKIQFETHFIGDIGVLDDELYLLCSSFLGVLEQPYPPSTYHAVLNHKGLPFGYLYQIPVLIGNLKTETSLIFHKQHNVVIRPESFRELFQGSIGLLRYETSEGKLITVFENPNIPYETRQFLFDTSLVRQHNASLNSISFNWPSLSFILTHKTQGENTYYFISSLCVKNALMTYQEVILLLVILFLFVAFLVYRLLSDTFFEWSQLSSRIHQLISPEHVRCFYQPIIDLRNNKIVACEVLMRLEDNGKLLFPDQFFPLVIERKLHTALDKAVVSRFLMEETHNPLPSSIEKVGFNFFPETITNGSARGEIQRLIQANQQRYIINLEVLEQDFHGPLLSEIAAIRKLGITISIDDFGTGYSNLASIKTTAPDFLKIDRSFTQGIDQHSVRASLIPEIITIARAVNAEVIAEGIEEAEQIPLLKDIGVEYAQGYYFAKPIPLNQLIELANSASKTAVA